ncbi:hypothetical protein Tco_0181189, partial [Tanacetum coccineum]
LPPREEVGRLFALTTPPPSPLTPLSSPLPHIPSPPLPVSPLASVLPASPPASLIHPLGYRAAIIWLRAEAAYEVGESSSTAAARPTEGLRVDYGFVATIYREIMRDLERDVGFGITDTWDEMLVDMPGAPTTDDTEMGRRMIKFTTRVRQDIDEIYMYQ